MRLTLNSNCEREFILQSFIENFRIDGRKCDEYRPLKITLGIERGSCFTELGRTKVFVQVSSELVTPKQSRPNSGLLHVNVEMSPMAAPNFEAGRLGERGIEISRLIERVLKESSCVDVESLCVKAGEKVWQIRVDIHVIDHDGSIIDCASVAVISALKSFRRPDVTISGETFIVHSVDDKEPVPLNLFHMPVCMTFGITENGKCITIDPSEREELVLDGEIVVAMNSHKEMCAVHCTGGNLLQKSQILRCISMAAQRTLGVSQLIKQTFEEDSLARLKKEKRGFSTLVTRSKVTYSAFTPHFPTFDLITNLKPKPDIQDYIVLPVSMSDESKKRGKIVKIGRPNAARLMTEREMWPNQNEEEDATIIDEIIDLESFKPSTATAAASRFDGKKDEIIEEMENVAIVETNMTKTKRKRRERTHKKDEDVIQLLMDIEDDDGAKLTKTKEPRHKLKDEDEPEILAEFKPKMSTRRRNKQKNTS